MVSLFERLFGRANQADKSGKMAKDRLQFVLVQDRINLPSEKMQQMQQEILEVISKYVTVDLDNVDFELSNRDRNGVLIAEIPFGKTVDADNDPDEHSNQNAVTDVNETDTLPKTPDDPPSSFTEETQPTATPSDDELQD